DKEVNQAQKQKNRATEVEMLDSKLKIKRFVYDSGLDFTYPHAVRGIYVTGNSAGGEKLDEHLKLVNSTDLNTMVIDIKDEHGRLTYEVYLDSPYAKYSDGHIDDIPKMLKLLEKEQIYPIARVVVFKDTQFAEEHPELSFLDNGKVRKNNRGEAFVKPFEKEVW